MAKGGYTPSEIFAMSLEDILFIDYYQELQSRNQIIDIAQMLGVRWTPEELRRMAEGDKNSSVETGSEGPVFIPLALAINPQLSEFLAKKGKASAQAYLGGGSESLSKGSKVQSMGIFDKEKFLGMVNGIGGRVVR